MRSPYATATGGLLAMAAALGIGRFVYTPILPSMMEALRLGNADAGLIASANFAGYLAGALLAAWPNLKGSRRAWLFGALAVSAATTAGMGLANTLLAFLILRCLGGIASAFALVFATALVLEHLAEQRRVALSALHFAGVGIGIAVSAALVATLSDGTWQSLWLASGALSLLAALAVALLLRDDSRSLAVTRHASGGAADPRLRALIVAYGLFGFGYVITATFVVAMVRHNATLRPTEPAIWILFGLSAAPSVAAWGWLSARLGIPATFGAACVVEAAGVLASVAWPTEAGVILAAVLVGGTFMALTALGLVQARALAPGEPRRALALMTSAFGLGQIIGPTFAGFVSQRLGGFAVPSATAAAALLIAAVLALTLRRPRPVFAAADADRPTRRGGSPAPLSARGR